MAILEIETEASKDSFTFRISIVVAPQIEQTYLFIEPWGILNSNPCPL